MVELLMSPTVSPIEGVKNKVKLYTYQNRESQRAAKEKPESSCSKSVDLNQEAEKVMAVFGVEPLPTLTCTMKFDITKRLGVRLPI